ncbi:MAG: glycosyltransferase family 4 protein [Candidatus Fermentibacteraceae bacterium]|nr:glycosyltransferase family 4 protein [Candidatus Fermentibacteraceae bacterium]MBN2609233.1 glycosyltransferase family 4 protein [Candidatus Fermentibacteraceae bacterium]
MRIGLEISPLAINATGIPNYIRRLLEGFASIDDGNEYFLYTNRPLPEDLSLPSRFRTVIVDRPHPRFQLWFQLELPRQMRRDRLDIFHGLFSRMPLSLPVPGIITSYDLSALRMPGMHKKWTRMTNLLYPLYIWRARRIIAISRFTAGELVRLFPRAAAKVSVVHAAAPPGYSEVTDPEILDRVRTRYGLPRRFMLFLGTMEPRKNLSRLLSAFAGVSGGIPHSLVIAGGSGWKNRWFLDSLRDSGIGDRVKLTGFVEARDVPVIMSMADAFIYTSLYEGFGLPILEAMACGTPVITSNVSSMPEVAGDAALLVDPLSVEDIAEGIRRMATDESMRAELKEKGLRRNREFSWENAARQTLEVYRSVLEGEPDA